MRRWCAAIPRPGERHLDALTWGFIPAFTKSLNQARRPVNARAETVTMSGMFHNASARRRCLVPAAAFNKWQAGPAGKTPYAIDRRRRCDGVNRDWGGLAVPRPHHNCGHLPS